MLPLRRRRASQRGASAAIGSPPVGQTIPAGRAGSSKCAPRRLVGALGKSLNDGGCRPRCAPRASGGLSRQYLHVVQGRVGARLGSGADNITIPRFEKLPDDVTNGDASTPRGHSHRTVQLGRKPCVDLRITVPRPAHLCPTPSTIPMDLVAIW